MLRCGRERERGYCAAHILFFAWQPDFKKSLTVFLTKFLPSLCMCGFAFIFLFAVLILILNLILVSPFYSPILTFFFALILNT